MSLRFFEGPAGSGKTTQLFEALAAILETHALGDHQRVLALTKMHGSRRRMHGRLATLPGLRGRFECTTIDSFAWRVLRRWNSLARARGNAGEVEHAYGAVCRSAGALLSEADVGCWATRSFPVVVIDEMQDSKDGQLAIVRALSGSAICLAAADGYQDLDASSENVAVAWAQRSGEIVSLAHNHRTSAAGLLAAAGALRDGQAVPLKGKGFNVLGAQNPNVGASFVARNLTWWMDCNDIVVLSPVHAESAKFVGRLIHRVEEKPIGNPPRGPYRIPWEVSQEDESERFLSNAPDDATAAGSTNVVFDLDLSVRDLSVRQELAFSLSAAHTLDTGVELHRLASAARLSITGDRNETVANPSSARGGTGLPDNLDSSLRGTRGGRVGAGSLHGDAVAVRRASPAVGLEHRSCNDRHRR